MFPGEPETIRRPGFPPTVPVPYPLGHRPEIVRLPGGGRMPSAASSLFSAFQAPFFSPFRARIFTLQASSASYSVHNFSLLTLGVSSTWEVLLLPRREKPKMK